MSSSEAQRSPAHHATEDANTEPTAPTGRPDANNGGVAPVDSPPGSDARQAADLKVRPDGDKGATPFGAGPLIDAAPDLDQQSIFPDASLEPRPREGDDLEIRSDPDESSFGGPLKLDDPDAA